MTRWPISDEAALVMYAGGHGNETARWWARLWTRVSSVSGLSHAGG